MLPVVRVGFPGIGNGTTSNAFTSLNVELVVVDENYNATIDMEQVKCASGKMHPPKVSVEYNESAQEFIFSQEPQEKEYLFCLPDDKVYGVMFESVLKRTRLVQLKLRGEAGTTQKALPEDWEADRVYVYCFATNRTGKMASDSRHLTVAINP